jgi:hypothetical protein
MNRGGTSEGRESDIIYRFVLCAESDRERVGETSKWLAFSPLEPIGIDIGARRSGNRDIVSVFDAHETSSFCAILIWQSLVVGTHSVYLAFEVDMVEIHVDGGFAQLH